jgi:hypothetical protein
MKLDEATSLEGAANGGNAWNTLFKAHHPMSIGPMGNPAVTKNILR